MSVLYVMVIGCTLGTNPQKSATTPCPKVDESRVAEFAALQDCLDSAQKIATTYHYRTGNEYSYTCTAANYQPKKMP